MVVRVDGSCCPWPGLKRSDPMPEVALRPVPYACVDEYPDCSYDRLEISLLSIPPRRARNLATAVALPEVGLAVGDSGGEMYRARFLVLEIGGFAATVKVEKCKTGFTPARHTRIWVLAATRMRYQSALEKETSGRRVKEEVLSQTRQLSLLADLPFTVLGS